MNARQQAALDFICQHVEFFVFPFRNQPKLMDWAIQDPVREEVISLITEKLRHAFVGEVKEKKEAKRDEFFEAEQLLDQIASSDNKNIISEIFLDPEKFVKIMKYDAFICKQFKGATLLEELKTPPESPQDEEIIDTVKNDERLVQKVAEEEALLEFKQRQNWQPFNAFKAALCGPKREETLIGGNSEPLKKLLLANSKLVDAIYELQQMYSAKCIHPIKIVIYQWYRWSEQHSDLVLKRKNRIQLGIFLKGIRKPGKEETDPLPSLRSKASARREEHNQESEKANFFKKRMEVLRQIRQEKSRRENEKRRKKEEKWRKKELEYNLKRARDTSRQVLVAEIKARTDEYINHLYPDLVKIILGAPVFQQLFERYYLDDNEREAYVAALQNDTLSQQNNLIRNSLYRFISDVVSERFEKFQGKQGGPQPTAFEAFRIQLAFSDDAKLLAFKYYHARNLQTILSQSDKPSHQVIQEARSELDKPKIRNELGEARGFWSWILSKLGLLKSHGKRLVGYFDEQISDAKRRRILTDDKEQPSAENRRLLIKNR